MKRFWSYGGREYYFDISERSCIDRITRALGVLSECTDEAAAPCTGEIATRHCEMISAFF